MGAKQSKRSVDISGKEAEGAGEVAAAGAGGEGRVEPIADVDTLKPQLNGDTQHIQPPEEITDKEKQLENGTPENEKDATTEKEAKEKEADKEAAPVTNGDAEQAEEKKENGDAPAAEETKKPKKEKVKKKWSLRSISFSRKDKPKQEKKQKDEEAKTNGEPEKVPEEAAETVAVEGEKQAEEAKPAAEIKEEKTPETPVTEPITNGSSTPESPKEASSPAEEPAPQERPETKAITEPEQLPVNGLSLDEPKLDKVEEPKVESKPEEPEPAPVVEIPAKTEVCVEQLPTIETTTPPPLPANPPPSSVASFAATTMAPELTDTSLAKADEPAPPATDVDNIEVAPADNEIPSPVPSPTTNDVTTEDTTVVPDEQILGNTENELVNVVEALPPSDLKQSEIVKSESPVVPDNVAQNELPEPVPEVLEEVTPEPEEIVEPVQDDVMPEPPVPEIVESENTNIEETEAIQSQQVIEVVESVEAVIENVSLVENNHDSPVTNGIEDIKLNGDANLTEQENLKNKTKEHVIETIECNGHGDESSVKTLEDKSESESDILPPAPCEEISQPAEEISESFPLPPSELSQADSSPELPATPTQETIVSDKLADLIPELPELPTETIQETASDVQVAN